MEGYCLIISIFGDIPALRAEKEKTMTKEQESQKQLTESEQTIISFFEQGLETLEKEDVPVHDERAFAAYVARAFLMEKNREDLFVALRQDADGPSEHTIKHLQLTQRFLAMTSGAVLASSIAGLLGAPLVAVWALVGMLVGVSAGSLMVSSDDRRRRTEKAARHAAISGKEQALSDRVQKFGADLEAKVATLPENLKGAFNALQVVHREVRPSQPSAKPELLSPSL